MKFWQKTYLSVLFVFLIVFDIGAYAILQKSYALNRTMDISRGVNEYTTIEKSLSYLLQVYSKTSDRPDYPNLIADFAGNYHKENIYIEVYRGNSLIFSNGYQFEGERKELNGNQDTTVYRKLNDKLWLFIGGHMDFEGFQLVMSRNSDYLQDYHEAMLDYLIVLSIIISIILSTLLILLLLQLTSPIRGLIKGVKAITAGAYSNRVREKGNDEVADLARNFNVMVDAVSTNIETIKRASREKENFINNLTHEIKTPITAIKGYSDFLNRANCTAEDRQMALSYIYEHVARLDLLSSKLMELLYLKNEGITPQRVDIRQLFAYVQRMMQPQLKAKQITLVDEYGAYFLLGDEVLLQTLLMNLVENSIKASRPGGRISLKSYFRDQDTVIEVKDDGKGIPVKDIDKITEAFYMVDKSRAKESGGIGLGLAICNQIADLHQAHLQISSIENEFTKISIIFTTPQ